MPLLAFIVLLSDCGHVPPRLDDPKASYCAALGFWPARLVRHPHRIATR